MGLIEKLHLTNKRSRRLVRSMLIGGVFPYQLRSFDARKYVWPALCIFGLSYIVVFTSYNLLHTKSFLQQIATAKTVLSSLMCLLVLLITMWKSGELVFFIDLTEKNFFQYSDEDRFHYKFSVSQRSENILIYTSSLYFFFIYGSAVLSQPIYLIFNPALLHSGTRQLIFTWVPWKDDTIFAFIMGHTTLIVVTIPVVMNIVGNVSVILNAYLELRNQFERMAYAMNTIVARTKSSVRRQNGTFSQGKIVNELKLYDDECEQFSPVENEQIEKYLIECIRHYQLVRK